MAKTQYKPLRIIGYDTGLVQQRENFLLPDDGFPELTNAYVWRERLRRKRGTEYLGRLRRAVTALAGTNADGTGTYSQSVFSGVTATEPEAEIVPGTLTFTIDPGGGNQTTYTDDGAGNMVFGAGTYTISAGTVSYGTGIVTLTFTAAPPGGTTVSSAMDYYPGLPVMGIEAQERTNSFDETIFFDQKYAYKFNSGLGYFQEFLPATSTTWNANATSTYGVDFFYSTNYWVSSAAAGFGTSNQKLFWVTNGTGGNLATSDPPRITDNSTWISFASGTWNQIDSTNFLMNFLCMQPFRGRMVTFNTWEGPTAAGAINYPNRIRWSSIGNPFIAYAAGPPAAGSWRSDRQGFGGYLDIPTGENITGIGQIRDNLVIATETQWWQLRYTGRSVQPFQVERVNGDLGTNGVKSLVNFDTYSMGIGSRGISKCDSYSAKRVDFKIPNFAFERNVVENGQKRTAGVRDYYNQLAYWLFSYAPDNSVFPRTRLVYNFENESWAIFKDSLTSLGIYRPQSSRTFQNTTIPWVDCAFTWVVRPEQSQRIVGGNQQGFISYLDTTSYNGISLAIQDITGNTTTATTITCPDHNLETGDVIKISDIITGTSFASSLNDGVFGIVVNDADTFDLYTYNAVLDAFSDPQLDAAATYVGGGRIAVRDNFSIRSKKFNYLDFGNSFQLGYLDILMKATDPEDPGAIAIRIYLDYDDNTAANTLPQNSINNNMYPPMADTFFNAVIPTTKSGLNGIEGTKFWQRVFAAARANFITIEYTFSNAQMAGTECEKDVQIDGQVLWIRRAGTISQI